MGQCCTVMKHTDLKIIGIGNCPLVKVYIMLRNLFNFLMIQKMKKIKTSMYQSDSED